MAIIFGGGELSSFTRFNAIEETTVGSFAVPARCGIHVKKNGFIRTDAMGGLNDVWFHCDISIGLITPGLTPIVVTNSNGVSLFSIGSDGKIIASGIQIGAIPLAVGRFTYDVHLRGGSAGLIEIYADSQVLFSANGSFNFTGMQNLTLAPMGTDATTETRTVYSQIIVANEVTVGMQLATLVLDEVGANNAWASTSPNAAADVNEIGLDDTTYIFAANAGMVETWATSDLAAQYTNIRAVIISALGKYSATGPKGLDAVTRISGANYFSSMSALGSGYTPAQAVYNNNPVTNAAWTRTEVNAAEFGIRSKV